MAFSLSPAVTVREIDLSAVISSASSTLGAFAGKFNWGPVNQPMLISDETDLVKKFGYPADNNAVDFFTIASFFAYTSGAWVTRIGNANMVNANLTFGASTPTPAQNIHIMNSDEFIKNKQTLETVSLIAKYPGITGNALSVAVCSNKDQYQLDLLDPEISANIQLIFHAGVNNNIALRSKEIPYTTKITVIPAVTDPTSGEITTPETTIKEEITDYIELGDFLVIDGIRYNIVDITDKAIILDRIYIGLAKPDSLTRYWRYATEFAKHPNDGEFHLVVIDNIGYFQQKNSILEIFQNLNRDDTTAIDVNGQSAYWINVINRKSSYLYAGQIAPNSNTKVAEKQSLRGGDSAEATVNLDEYIMAYGIYANSEVYDAPLLIGGNAITTNDVSGAVLANYLIYSLAEVRKDMVAFLSPPLEAVLDNKGKEAISCVRARDLLGSSSYATLDCNWKYMYDKYNDTFRWIPMNGDVAGVYARNDRERDPWVSAAGTTKGRLKNIVKFAWNPDKTARDLLYPNDINPVFSLPIAGPVLFGDKTILGKNTALSRVNVRRLLIILEKAIATAAVDLLFEFNDEFTQRRFVSMVDPLLKDAKGRRGLTAYKVIADSTVNTPQVIQNNGFVGQIYIKPNYTISDIRLDFIVVNASASFEEVIGSV